MDERSGIERARSSFLETALDEVELGFFSKKYYTTIIYIKAARTLI